MSSVSDAPRIVVHGTVEAEGAQDKYTAGIELSNKCREFYVCRLQAVETYRKKLGLKLMSPTELGSNPCLVPKLLPPHSLSVPRHVLASQPHGYGSNPCLSTGKLSTEPGFGSNPCLNRVKKQIQTITHGPGSHPCLTLPTKSGNSRKPSPIVNRVSPAPNESSEQAQDSSLTAEDSRKKTSIDRSMDLLKREMASLIDQDLVLMRQLLTLNDQIEELKWQRKLYGCSHGSLTSSCQLDESACMLSEGDLLDNPSIGEMPQKYPTPSSLSLYTDLHTHPEMYEGDEKEGPGQEEERRAPLAVKEDITSDIGSSGELAHNVAELEIPSPGLHVEGRGKYGEGGGGGGGVVKRVVNPSIMVNSYRVAALGDQQSLDSGIHDPDHLLSDIAL